MYLFKLNKSISSELTVAHKLMKPLTTDVFKKVCTSSFTNCEMYLFKLNNCISSELPVAPNLMKPPDNRCI